MKKFKAWFFIMWRPLLAFTMVALVVGCLMGFRLGGLTRGASHPEQSYIANVTSGRQLLHEPTYLVHKLPVYLLFKLHIKSLGAYRAISAVFASLAVISCFFILREWYTDRVAILTSWLFLASAWVLHIGRLATPEACYLLLLPLVWAGIWLYKTSRHKTALLLLSVLAGLSVYIPGFIWVVLAVAIWQHRRLWVELKRVPRWLIPICVLIVSLMLAPLVWASIKSPSVGLQLAGLPTSLPHWRAVLNNVVNIPLNIVLRGPDDPIRWLGRLPVLDIFSSVMLILGIYSLRYHLKSISSRFLIGSSLILVVLVGVGGLVSFTVLMPLVYLLIAGGIAFMLQQWYAVFPRNPIARGIATTLLSITVLLVSFYHINHYFIAWPQTPATKQVFGQSLVK